ncbi:MAG: cyclic beta 1-2 glucan synthetase [Cyclobacteriaceae bacterium]|nr:cyclic beta 1-2 glucan synthetase [Cyclobacteriaceae bacterium]
MKVKATVIDEILSPLRLYPKKDFTRKEVNENPPLRAELFSTEQMEYHAQQLAVHQTVSYGQSAELLLKELSDNEKILFQVNSLLQKSVKEKKSISPAAEWMLDNFYLIEDQIRIAKRHLPKGYSKGLPKLKSGPLAGFPRVYNIAIEIIAHSDGHIDIYQLQNFITAYQKERHLTLGELWAFPIMLRLALLENLSRVAARIAVDRNDSALANKWARKIIDTVENNPKDLVLVIADMARSEPPLVSSFVAEFVRKLQWKGIELTLPLHWVEQQLSETDNSTNSMVLMENQHQAANQVSVSNSINSLRFLAKTDWRDFVENMSVVEKTLRGDVHSVYATMDFYTRDHYRHAVEDIANHSGLSESDVARLAIDLARKSFEENVEDERKAHVGYYLLEAGLVQTESAARVHLPLWKIAQKKIVRSAGILYTITAVLTTILIAGGMVLVAADGIPKGWLILVGIMSLISASHFALSIANWWSTLWIKPAPLPKLDYSSGIPAENRTLVVVPTLLVSPAQIEKLIEELEVRFLSNRDPNLLFGLVTDFRDAPEQILPEDENLIQLATERIIGLNTRYNRSTNDTFFLFHRPRTWNDVDQIWMGYERKRGKLTHLNHLLRGRSHDKFSVILGDEQIYKTVKYIITLDTDTQLPREAAWKLVGLMAHPLNKPHFDETKNRVTEGYTIIQPRIAISLHGAPRSGFTRLYENDSGIDPYTRVTSDVYQDLFGEGSYIGKGIYEIDAFEKALNNRLRENRILSHDLLEGSYARCGFASDIQFYEDYPARYAVDINRRHRWIRGDWQIGNWFLPIVPGAKKRSEKNPISLLSKWKIFDNLRRSVVPIAHLMLLIGGWTLLPASWFWTLSIIAIMLLPSVLSALWSSIRKPKEIGLTQHINNTVGLTSKSILQSLFAFVCLPYEAFVSFDAIARTLWRIHISRKKLLEWNPSGLNKKQNTGLLNTYKVMWIAPVLSAGILSFMVWQGSIPQLLIAIPFLILWILSPAIVSFIDKPLNNSKSTIHDTQKIYLRELARKSWSFFENLIGTEDHWLPPDNLQQYPIPVIAHRTSPTNIGLSVLANLSACDFGYATTTQLIERTVSTFTTLQKLERYQGHFYNWYDTQTLSVLSPRYISTVDSGNLAGHLLTFRQGLLGIPQQRILERKIMHGLQDTLRLVIHEISTTENGLRAALTTLHDSIAGWNFQLPALKEHIENTLRQYLDLTSALPKEGWSLAFEQHLNRVLKEITLLAPWVTEVTIPEKFKDWQTVTQIPTLEEVARMQTELEPALSRLRLLENSEEETHWLHHVEKSIQKASEVARERIATLHLLATQSAEFADMEYNFLYDKSQHLLAIGYHVSEHYRDLSYYDLLASEARLSSFVAIAQGKIPQENWFALGRRLTTAGNTPVLLSWSGSMFEYLMPGLVMPTYKNTLLDEMCMGTVIKQIEYGEQQDVPWGISESCYNLVDAHLTYQYRAFGIPGLGFKRGLGQDLVIAPYATILALMVDPRAACENLERMKAKGFEGQYGFYEAIDYTPIRLARDQRHAVIKTFMAHHQGMSLLSLAYLLLDQPMQKRFEADTQVQTALLLLQEQVPKSVGFYAGSSDHEEIAHVSIASEIRFVKISDSPVPEVQLLSNGHYFVMLSNAGGGYSRWKELAVTRWREDATCDHWGTFCYINDRDKNQFWSTAHQPTLKEADQYEAIFSQGKVEFRRRDNEIETYTTVIVSPEDDVEVRRIHLTNHALTKRKLSVTSYSEVVLAAASADDAHPAFSNLFVQTEINEHQHTISCTRRPRSKDEHPPWMFHLMKVNGVEVKQVSYETDRTKFIGRGHTLVHPQVMDQTKPLSGAQGSVLDPIVAIQYKITLEPGESAIVDMVTGVAETKEVNQSLIDKYQDRHLRDRAFELSWTHSQVVLRQIGATEADAQVYGKLASSILYMNPTLRAQPNIVLKNQRQQSSLWSYSISGDLPIVLLIISDFENISLVKQLIKAKAYWQIKGLAVDLVILNEDPGGYRQVLQDQIQGLIAAGIGVPSIEKQGRIFVRPIDQVSEEDRMLFQAVARIIISDKKGTLEDQVNRRAPSTLPAKKLILAKAYPYQNQAIALPTGLQYFNGTGGFSPDGKEYVIITDQKKRTPLPWINVIANAHFGTIVSESGSSYTWFENAHEFRLTPWKNDPLLDSSGEAFYIRDEESGFFWSPMGLPSLGKTPYVAKHGFGYSTFEHTEEGIHTEVRMHVDRESPVKFVVITVTNQSDRLRKLTATGYVEWVLGELRSKSAMHIATEYDITSRALIARNRYQADFQHHVAFFDVDEKEYTYTTDRTEFIGRNGTLQNPDAMRYALLSGKSGACLDACAAIQVPFELETGRKRKIIFKIGAGKDIDDCRATLQRFKRTDAAIHSLEQVNQFWNATLGAVQVETPDTSINILANGWLLYQVLSCRLWGRSGLYQSGGAFGFRDQLQDVLALMHTQPTLTRQQILVCASRQFQDGDVQHWWHPPTGRGVRTLCSDDYLWLPFVTSRYVSTTGDDALLDEPVSFLQGRKLNMEEESYYDLPVISDQHASVYSHCKQSIVHALRFGEHGLPLMGSGDWNDGMNMVGIHGKGESIWLAFFLYDVLIRFTKIASLQGDLDFVAKCEKHAKQLKRNIKTHAWDGEWYLRAFFDDGSPLGSKSNDECKIDAISQSWSVLSGGGESTRSLLAMQAVNTFLINREKSLIQLLNPPFDTSSMDPGYIKGYVPGVRENGGQYSHAAIWMIMAFAKLGDQDKTAELLNMINPIHHNTTPEEVKIYKAEPYVIAADVYGVEPHTGRGGWTWYTGSAGWMYQLILESFLGLKREGNTLKFEPCTPKGWKSFAVKYCFKETVYHIHVQLDETKKITTLRLDGVTQTTAVIPLVNDKLDHHIILSLKSQYRSVAGETSEV